MNDSIEIVSKYSIWEIITLLVAIVVITSILLTFLKKVYDALETWRQKKNGVENKEKTLEDRVSKLEENDIIQAEKLDTISAGVQQVAATLETLAENNRKTAVSTAKSTLYRWHKEFLAKGYMTLAEQEMFDSLKQVYLDNGGNSVFRSRIIPEVEKLPIKE